MHVLSLWSTMNKWGLPVIPSNIIHPVALEIIKSSCVWNLSRLSQWVEDARSPTIKSLFSLSLFFLTTRQPILGPWWRRDCVVWLVSRSSVNWKPFWSFWVRGGSARPLCCSSRVEWPDLGESSFLLAPCSKCSSLLCCTFATFASEASSSKWARTNKTPACCNAAPRGTIMGLQTQTAFPQRLFDGNTTVDKL